MVKRRHYRGRKTAIIRRIEVLEKRQGETINKLYLKASVEVKMWFHELEGKYLSMGMGDRISDRKD